MAMNISHSQQITGVICNRVQGNK